MEASTAEKVPLVGEATDTSAGQKRMPKETFEPPPLLRAVTTYVGYLILYVVSLVGDFLRSVGLKTTGHVEVTKKEVYISNTPSVLGFCIGFAVARANSGTRA